MPAAARVLDTTNHGGTIVGPGEATVLIGGMPAAVMGDMCVCVGPPDTIALGSMGVMIGGKPAARMGDTCAHGGTIVVGCFTVLIGEMSPGGGANVNPIVNAFLLKLKGFEAGTAGGMADPPSKLVKSAAAQTARQTITMKMAAVTGAPFCAICEELKRKAEENA